MALDPTIWPHPRGFRGGHLATPKWCVRGDQLVALIFARNLVASVLTPQILISFLACSFNYCVLFFGYRIWVKEHRVLIKFLACSPVIALIMEHVFSP